MDEKREDLDGKIERKVAIFERSVNLPPDVARIVAEDVVTTGSRKPASDAVDRERSLRAQAAGLTTR